MPRGNMVLSYHDICPAELEDLKMTGPILTRRPPSQTYLTWTSYRRSEILRWIDGYQPEEVRQRKSVLKALGLTGSLTINVE